MKNIPRPKKSNKECPIHHVKYLVLGNHAVCPICEKNKINQEKRNMAKDFINYPRHALHDDSLIDDKDLIKCTFDNFKANTLQEKQVKELARQTAGRYLKNPSQDINTILFGSVGTGKSHLAMAMIKAINQYSSKPQKNIFINTNMLFVRLWNSINHEETLWNEKYTIRLLTNANVIVLDDLGSASGMNSKSNEASNFIQRILFEILNGQKRIIVTTNLNQEQLKKLYNPKIISRLFRGAKDSIIDFKGIEDKRVLI